MLHRDIKPSNIKLTPRGQVKLVDFGLVKLLMPDDSQTLTVVQGRGTVQYTPLEQYGGDTGHTDSRADIYSLGATLYHLLTGKAPADAKERFLKPGSLLPPRNINPDISPQTERSVLLAMAMHPDQRPSNVTELHTMLFSTSMSSGTPAPTLLTSTEWAQAARSNRWLIAATVGLAGAAVVVTLLSPPLPSQTPAAASTAQPTVTAVEESDQQ